MITNYTKPQLIIKQILERVENNAGPSMNAFVFGPQYELHRVTNEDEKAEKSGVLFQTVTGEQVQVVPFEELAADNPIDEDYTKLYGENLEGRLVKYGQYSDADSDSNNATLDAYIKSVGDNAEIIFKDDAAAAATMSNIGGGSLHDSLHGRNVTTGDIVYLKFNGEVVKRTVVGVNRVTTTPDATTVAGSSSNPDASVEISSPDVNSALEASVAFDPSSADIREYLEAGSLYAGKFSELFTVVITQMSTGLNDNECALASITAASGNFAATDVAFCDGGANDSFELTDASMPGVTFNVDTSINDGEGFRLGDTFSFAVVLDYAKVTNANFEFFGSTNYAYDVDDTLIFEVTDTADTGSYNGVVLKISDTAGLLTPIITEIAQDGASDRSETIVLGNTGLSFRLKDLSSLLNSKQLSLRVGDFYTKDLIIGKEDGTYGVVVVSGPAGNVSGLSDNNQQFNDSLKLDVVDFRKLFTGFVSEFSNTTTPQWFIDSDATLSGVVNDTFGINVNPGLSFNEPGRAAGYTWLPVAAENSRDSLLFSHYRALVKAQSDEKIHFVNDVVSQSYGTSYSNFGKIDIDNPLGFGINCALSGSQGKGIYAARLEDESDASWAKILEKAEKNSNLYAICPLTDDLEIQQMAASHVSAMSQEKIKRWRRVYIGTDSPLAFAVIGGGSDADRPEATISELNGQNIKVTDAVGRFQSSLINPGDLFRFNYSPGPTGALTYDEYEVDYILSEEELVLVSGPDSPAPEALQYEVWKDDDSDNLVSYVAARSSSFGNRRVVNVWVDRPLFYLNNTWVELSNYYIAAEMAGLRSAVQPQQGLTHTEVRFVGSAPSMFTKFTETHLDDIAASGTWVVTQEYEDGPRFIRHQLTTDTDNGNLYYEDSVGTNLDEISYAINTRLLHYIGKRNANASTVIDIYNDVFSILTDRTTAETGVTVGAALNGFSSLEVKIDDVFKDRVNVDVDLTLPLPLNTIVVTLNAVASFGDLSVSQTTSVLSKDGLDRILDTSELTYS